MRPLRVAALDLSLRATGIACTHDSRGEARLFARTVCPPATSGRATAMDHQRVHKLFTAVRNTVLCKPDVVVIEWLPQFEGHGDASLRIAELHGIVKHWLWSQRIPYVDVRPVHLKQYATGNGGSDKDAVREQVIARYGRFLHVSSHDEADATALLAMALDAHGQPLADVPNTHRRALSAVTWPALEGAMA